jgi:hypothetical protein
VSRYINYLPENSKENHFVDYMIKNGYPNYLTILIDPIVLLYHINTSKVSNKVEPNLQKAL